MSKPKKPQLPVAPDQPACTAQLMQNYRQGVPVSAGSQIATAPNYSTGVSEAFSIGTTGRVHRISPDPKSDTGWNTADLMFPGEARFIAAGGKPDGTIDVYASDAKNRLYRNNGSFSSLVTGDGKGLQVLGIGNDGYAHRVAWQGGAGKWRNDGPDLPVQSVQMGEIATGKGQDNLLRLIGFGLDDGHIHQIAVQDRSGRWREESPIGIQGQWHGLVTGNKYDGTLHVFGLGIEGRPYLVTWLNQENWQWQFGMSLPGEGVYTQLAAGNGNGNTLQVIGLGLDGHAYLVAWLNETGWHGGFALHSPSMRLKSLTTGRGNNKTLQVFGIGEDGYAYRVTWQDEAGNWKPDCFRFPFQGVRLTTITTGRDSDKNLEVIGLGVDGQVYLIGRQDRFGVWRHPDEKLPRQDTPLIAIAAGSGAFQNLQVVGIGDDGAPYVVAQQTRKDKKPVWAPGQKLPGGWQRLTDPGKPINGIQVGYDQEKMPFVVLALQFAAAVSEGFAILKDGTWTRFGSGTAVIYGWSAALVPFSGPDKGVHRGVYASMENIHTIGDRGVLGELVDDEFGKSVLGRFSTVTAANSAAGYSGVFALLTDDHGVYYLDPANPSDPNLSLTKISHDTAVSTMVAGSNTEGLLEVLALSTEGFLYHTRQDQKSQTGWEFFLELNKDLKFTQLVVGKNPTGYSDVFAVTKTDGLYHIWQDPISTEWHFDQIDVPKGKVEEFSSYNVQMTVYDASGVVAADSQVTIFSENPVLLEINGSSRFLDSNHPWEGTANSAGQVTIGMKIDSLGVRPLKARTQFMPAGDRISIDPSGPSQEVLANVNVDTLKSAMWTDDQGKQFPLLPTEEAQAAAPDIMNAVTRAFTVAKTMPASLSTGTRYLDPRNDPRVARYVVGGNADAPEIHPAAVDDLCYHVDFSSGVPVFRHLDREQYAAQVVKCKELLAVSNFLGFDADWGDVFDAIEGGIITLSQYFCDGLNFTLCLVIKGFHYVFDATIKAVEQAFDLAQEVFKAVGAGFEEVFRWLGVIFNWDDILRTKEVIKYSLHQVSEFSPFVLNVLQRRLSTYISSVGDQLHDTFNQVRSSLVGRSAMDIQRAAAPALPEKAMMIEHNIVWTGFMNNVANAPPPPGGANLRAATPEAMAAMQNLMEVLDQTADHFQSSEALRQARDYFAQAMTSADQFVESALAGLLSIVEGVGLFVLETANTLMTAILNAAGALIGELIHEFDKPWDIPFVSDLYYSKTNSCLSTLDLSALIVAIPATLIYKLVHGKDATAPFPDADSVTQFKAGFNLQSLLEASGLGPAGASGEAADASTPLAAPGDWRKVGVEVFGIVGYVSDFYGTLITAALDFQNLADNTITVRKRIEQGLSAASLVTQVIGHFGKVPWPWKKADFSCETKESFALYLWIYGLLPIGVDLVFWNRPDPDDRRKLNRRVARASEDTGTLVAALLGAIDIGLWITKLARFHAETSVAEILTDIFTFCPKFLAWLRLPMFNKTTNNAGTTVLIVLDVFCGLAAVVVGFIELFGGAASETRAPELVFAEAH